MKVRNLVLGTLFAGTVIAGGKYCTSPDRNWYVKHYPWAYAVSASAPDSLSNEAAKVYLDSVIKVRTARMQQQLDSVAEQRYYTQTFRGRVDFVLENIKFTAKKLIK